MEPANSQVKLWIYIILLVTIFLCTPFFVFCAYIKAYVCLCFLSIKLKTLVLTHLWVWLLQLFWSRSPVKYQCLGKHLCNFNYHHWGSVVFPFDWEGSGWCTFLFSFFLLIICILSLKIGFYAWLRGSAINFTFLWTMILGQCAVWNVKSIWDKTEGTRNRPVAALWKAP